MKLGFSVTPRRPEPRGRAYAEAHLGFRAGHWKGQEAPEQDAAASSCGWQGELAGGST